MLTHREMNASFGSARAISILQPINQETSFTFKSDYLRSTFNKSVAPVVFPLMDPGKLKTFWKEFTIQDDVKDTCDSWEEDKNTNSNRNWRGADLSFYR